MYIQDYFFEMQDLLGTIPHAPINRLVDMLHEGWQQRRQVFIMGNGGSASTASHFVCDLSKNTRVNGHSPFRVIGLTDNLALITAFANDEGYENVFAQQLHALVRPNDIVIGISTSGNSANVTNATEVANKAGAYTVGLTGFDGGRLAQQVDLEIRVPSSQIEMVEDVHLMIEHMVCLALRERLKVMSTDLKELNGVH